MSAQPEHAPAPDLPVDRLSADLPAPGPGSSDADLAAWRDAAASGQLPSPTRSRWQVLRAGVVNLWEFDTAEYWFADGRAQFVGQNQSGKSTLMALTTLIMLAGDLDRQYVDTFGERHKSFRYYVEPTDDANDRRGAGDSLNRGWAWVEYGRLAGDTPEFFTTLLYAQARRGAKEYVKQWSTCAGTARVGREILLTSGAHTRQPGEVSSMSGFKIAGGGTDYRQRISTSLFGFDDTDRLDAVVKILKVLRTPHLGRKLDPVFFTQQMREALPAIAKSEIDELAEGWDQLDKLANDRDSAVSAQQAVTAFLRKAWNPWADSVLRRHADELAAAVTRFDDVTKNIRRADEVKDKATARKAELDGKVEVASDALTRADLNFEDLLDSQAYKEAHAATARVEALKTAATEHNIAADTMTGRAGAARTRAKGSAAALKTAAEQLGEAQLAQQDAVGHATEQAAQAGLPPDTEQWATAGDVGRLSRAVDERRGHLRIARKLLSALAARTAEQNTATRRDEDARLALAGRAEEATAAETRRDAAVQELSDKLETWAAALADPPPDELRTGWLDSVLEQVEASNPRAVLASQIRASWLEPRTNALRETVRAHEQVVTDSTDRADQFDVRIRAELQETDPQPAGPVHWTRRDRPASSPVGAPLWLLLDPVDEGDDALLARLEAALDATGLLDAWISPDGVYVADRDGHDLVVDLRAGDPGERPAADEAADAGIGTLASVLRPADSSTGPLTATLTALLRTVAYAPAGTALPASAVIALSGDGRWRTPVTAGTAGPGEHGAQLLGTAARAVARARRVRALRDEVTVLRLQVLERGELIAQGTARIRELAAQAQSAPLDDRVIAAALACGHAHRELTKAQQLCDRRAAELLDAETMTASASSSLHEHTGAHGLPITENGLVDLGTALDQAEKAVGRLQLALQKVTATEETVARERGSGRG